MDENKGRGALQRAQRGDEDAFRTLMSEEEETLWYLLFCLTGEEERTARAVERTVCAAWKRLPNFTGDMSLRVWLCRLALQEAEHGADSGTRRDAPDREPPRDACLRRALSALGEGPRRLLALREGAGLTEAETASVLGLGAGVVRSRLARARGALVRALLQKDGFFSAENARSESEAPPCAAYAERLSAAADGAAGEEDAAAVRAHLEGCAACRRQYGRLEELKAAFADLRIPPPPDLSDRAAGAVRGVEQDVPLTDPEREHTRPSAVAKGQMAHWWRPLLRTAALVVAAALAVTAVFILQGRI